VSNKTDILVVGSLGYDYVASGKTLPTPGQTILGHTFATFLGGKGNNQAVGAARAGGKVTFLGRVGKDDPAIKIRAGLAEAGVDDAFVDAVDGSSQIAMILTADDGENCIVVVSGANATISADVVRGKAKAFETPGYVLAQLETPIDGVTEAAKLARENGAVFILDPAPAQPLPEELLKNVDWFTPNETEAKSYVGFDADKEPLRAALAIQALGPRNVVLKLSSKGAVVLEQGKPAFWVPAFKVTAVDTTAAGDSFNGAFAVALSEGKAAPDAVRFACAAAAISVTRRGAGPSMPHRPEIEDMLKTALDPIQQLND
jgi:ribokinase